MTHLNSSTIDSEFIEKTQFVGSGASNVHRFLLHETSRSLAHYYGNIPEIFGKFGQLFTKHSGNILE